MHVLNHTDIKLVFLSKILPILYTCIGVSTSNRNCWKRFMWHIHPYLLSVIKQKSPNSSTLNTNWSEKKYLSKKSNASSPHNLFFQWKNHNHLRPCESKAERPGNIFVEGHTPAAFQPHVQTKAGYFPTPASSPPVFRGRKVGQSGLGGARVCTFSYLGSWDMQWSTPVLQLRHCSKPATASDSQPCRKNSFGKESLGSSALLSPLASIQEPVTRMRAIYMSSLSHSVSTIHPFLKIPKQCKTTCFTFQP